MNVRVVLSDGPSTPDRRVLGVYERVGVYPHIFGARMGCMLSDDHGREIAQLIVGWQAVGSNGKPYGRRWARMDVEAT